MAVQISAVQPGPVMCGTESVTYGTQPVTFAPNTQGIHAINSPNAIEADEQFQEIVVHQLDFGQQKDIPTFNTKTVNLQFPLMGGSAANSPPLVNPLFRAAGMYGAVIAGTPGSYRWVQATRSQLATMAATIAQEMVGETTSWVDETNGCYGTISFVGAADQGLIGTFTGQGLYQAPQSGTLKSVYGGGTTDWSAGTNNANKFILSSTNRVTVNNGGSDYLPLVKQVRFDLGVTYGPITDVNAGGSYGVFGIRISRMQPTLTLTIALDGDTSANVAYDDLYADAQSGTTHDVSWTYTDLAGRTLTFTFPTAQVRTKRKGTAENIRTIDVNYKLQGTTPWQVDQA